MPRRCSVCCHPDRQDIDQALVAGEAFRGVARRFAVSPDSVERHARGHLPAALVKANGAAEVASAERLLDHAEAARTRAVSLLDRAEKLGDLRAAATLLRECRGAIELLARLHAQLRDAGWGLGSGERVTVTLNIGENTPIDPADYPQAFEDEDEGARANLEDSAEPLSARWRAD